MYFNENLKNSNYILIKINGLQLLVTTRFYSSWRDFSGEKEYSNKYILYIRKYKWGYKYGYFSYKRISEL